MFVKSSRLRLFSAYYRLMQLYVIKIHLLKHTTIFSINDRIQWPLTSITGEIAGFRSDLKLIIPLSGLLRVVS
jgi:hypothetical protein